MVTAAISMHMCDTEPRLRVPSIVAANDGLPRYNDVCLVAKHECGSSILRRMVEQYGT